MDVKLAHFTVKEYLVLKGAESGPLSRYQFRNEKAQAFISGMAVTYFIDPNNFNESKSKGIPSSLRRYFAEFWPEHAIEALDSGYYNTKQLQHQIDLLFSLDHSQGYITWLQIFDHDRETYDQDIRTEYPQPLYYAALLGLRMTAKMLLVQGCRVKMYEGKKGNALNAAAIEGQFEIIKDLERHHERIWRMADLARIAQGIRRNIRNTFVLFLTKEAKADVVITEEVVKAAAGNYNGKEVVKAAAGNKHNGKEVMMLLLEKRGADVVITEEIVKAAAGNAGAPSDQGNYTEAEKMHRETL
ncbi:hypothetical protein HYALB_00010009 [Hymenoscyphus albidus]|uniref:Ankyrin repeat protein n=1 Tax=Hymenoscyphus albidus TaxID=595503 RepID=A0A9N9QBS2_9HELO|nr:hypothetical protein HYALB_00010009 [Hymenoscyphus albidus]